MASASWAADPVTFRLNDTQTPETPSVQGALKFGEILRVRSNGRFSIDLRSRSLDSPNFMVGQIRNGSLDMARLDLAALGNYAPTVEVLSMPYLVSSRAEMRSLLAGSVGRRVMWELETAGLIGLCFYESSARSFYGSRPIRTATDMTGLTIGVSGSEVSSEVVRALGGKPLPLPMWQTRNALATGVTTVSEGNWVSYAGMRHFEVAPYYSLTEHARAPDILVLSKIVWDRLSPADRDLIRDAARESGSFQREALDTFEQTARRNVTAAGAKIADVDRQSFVDALVPLRRKLLTERDQRHLVDSIRTPGIAAAPDQNNERSIPLPK